MSDTKYGALTLDDLACVCGGCEDYVPPGLSAEPSQPSTKKKVRGKPSLPERAPVPLPRPKPRVSAPEDGSSTAYTKFLNNPGIDMDFFRFLRDG